MLDPNTKRFTYKGNRIEVWKGNDNEGKLGYDPWHFRPTSGPALSKVNWHVMGPSKTRDEAIALAKFAVDRIYPGRQNPADPALVQQARRIGYDQGTIDRLRREDMPPPWPRNMMPALRGLVFPQGARSNDMLPPDVVDAYKDGYRAGRKGMRNPGRGWFARCMDSVSASGSAVDPGAVCGAQLKKMGYRRRNPAHTAWNVYLNGKKIDTVFFDADIDADQVYRSLVNHDGYDPGIVVKKQRKKRNLSIRKYKKGRLSGYEEATGRAVKWFRARGKRTRAERKAKRTRTNPTKRYQIRAAGRVFTVSAKTKRAAQAEVAKYCRQHGLKTRMRNAGPMSIRKHKKRLVRKEREGALSQRDALTLRLLRGLKGRRLQSRNTWGDDASGHSAAAKLGWERRRYSAESAKRKRTRKRNRSASMLSPRTGRRTIRSVEQRTSQALRRYLGGRR